MSIQLFKEKSITIMKFILLKESQLLCQLSIIMSITQRSLLLQLQLLFL